jgi:hypothetical protein
MRNIGVLINVTPLGNTIGNTINKPKILLKKTSCVECNSEEAILIHMAMTAKQQADPKAGKKP